MKIYISCDIEGACGIVNWCETDDRGYDYERFRKIMTNDVIAVCESLIANDIKDIYVRDAHDSARNIIFENLPKEVKIIRGWSNGPCDMMDYIDETFDGAIFIDYHSPCRSDQNSLSHTQNLSHVEMKLNGKIISEYLLNAYFASIKKVPVIMVSGDSNLCSIVNSENEFTKTVSTKVGYHGACVSKTPKQVLHELKEATTSAIKMLNDYQKEALFVKIPKTFDLEIQFKEHQKAYKASFYPNTELIDTDRVVCHAKTLEEMFNFMLFCD